MSLFIEGVAFPLGELNANGWGVPYTEAENAIKTLKTSVVRVCSRIDPHLCDIFEDPFSEIGHVVDAWQDGDDIIARAEITDQAAAQKIEDGTWKSTWSIYSLSDSIDSGGWAHGIQARSMTLVNDPAWEQATWSIVASKTAGKVGIHSTPKFRIISKTGDQVTPDPKDPPKNDPDASVQLAAAQEENKKLSEQLKAMAAENEEMKKLAAEKARQVAGSMPVDEVQKLIATEATKIANEKVAAYEEERKRASALEKLTAARSKLGVKTEPANYANMRSTDIEKLVADFEGIQAAAGKNVHLEYPSGASGSPKVGRYNSKTKLWE